MKDKKKYFLPYPGCHYSVRLCKQILFLFECPTKSPLSQQFYRAECPDCFGTLKVAPDIRQTLAAVTLRHITRFMLHNLISSVNGVGAAVWPVVTRRR